MKLAAKVLDLLEFKNNRELISALNSHILDDNLADKGYKKSTGAFDILSGYFKDIKKMKDPDKRIEFIRNSKEKDLPELEELIDFALKNKKKFNLK